MLIDDITIRARSGNGGDGAVAFNATKMSLGPTGGSGGNGGSVFFEGVSDLSVLNRLRNQKMFAAENGQRGRRQLNDGNTGKDLIIPVPVGTVIHDVTAGNDQEITKIGQKILGAKGGMGGKGNFHFRGPENTSPRQFQHGSSGIEVTVRLELKLIADIGIIGLPNAGKSSLINELTNAKSKVANYQFTTLEPNLGAYYNLIIADIPGLIEGASKGKGLGMKFLRHIERTSILFHLVSAESENPVRDYKTIRKELGTYNKALTAKKEFLFLSKTDMVSPADAKKKLTKLKKINPNVLLLSIHDFDAITAVQKILNVISEQKKMI